MISPLTRCRRFGVAAFISLVGAAAVFAAEPVNDLRQEALVGLKKAARFYSEKVSTHGGYTYYYSVDLKQAWGEGVAAKDQIWTEPPGTPAVGMAFLKAYEATEDSDYLIAATNAGMALVYGQLQSGGWSQTIDFDPKGERVNRYRNGRGAGPNHSSLDDNQTQSSIAFLALLDQALGFKNPVVHEAVQYALDGLLAAQFLNGAFPQGWRESAPDHPVLQASYPKEWPRIWPKEEYWKYYTLNDGLPDSITSTLLIVHEVYRDQRSREALIRFGDFLLLAQMPAPQPAWSQQYNFEMQPTWARKFEPPAISVMESEDAVKALLRVYRLTGDKKYLAAVRRALPYLKSCQLADGRMARYYELKTNKPLYMNRPPGVGSNSSAPGYYTLTYDDTNLPSHYGWKQPTEIDALMAEFAELDRASAPRPPALMLRMSPAGKLDAVERSAPPAPGSKDFPLLEKQVREILTALDSDGRWVNVTEAGKRLVGQPAFKPGFHYIGSDAFNWNVQTLSDYLMATRHK
ncbi:MAG TPA: pectate lyase [Opitutus sp.]|nr:pectate lyase [Opitutus sp.]